MRIAAPLVFALLAGCTDDPSTEAPVDPDAGTAPDAQPCDKRCAEDGRCLPDPAEDCGEGSFPRADGTCAARWTCPDGWSRAPDDFGCVAPDALRDDCPDGSFALPDNTCSAAWTCPDGWVRRAEGGCDPALRDDCPAGTFPLPGARCSAPWECLDGWVRAPDGPGCLPAPADCPDGAVATPSGVCLGDDAFEDCGDDPWGPHDWPPDTVYVDADAAPGGDGTRERPHSTLEDALAVGRHDMVVALAAGAYPRPLQPPAGLLLGGRCAARTTVTGRMVTRTRGVTLRDLTLERLTVGGATTAVRVRASGLDVASRLDAEDLRVDGPAIADGVFNCDRCRFEGGAVRALTVQGGETVLDHGFIRRTSGDGDALQQTDSAVEARDLRVRGGILVAALSSLNATGLEVLGGETGVWVEDGSAQIDHAHIRPDRTALRALSATVTAHHVVFSNDAPGPGVAIVPQNGGQADLRWVDASGFNGVVQAFDPGTHATLRDVSARRCNALADVVGGARVDIVDAAHSGDAVAGLRVDGEGTRLTADAVVLQLTTGVGLVVRAGASLELSHAAVSAPEGVSLFDATLDMADALVDLPGEMGFAIAAGTMDLRRVVITRDNTDADVLAAIFQQTGETTLEDVRIERLDSPAVLLHGGRLVARRLTARAGYRQPGSAQEERVAGSLQFFDARAELDGARLVGGRGPIILASAAEVVADNLYGARQEGILAVDDARLTLRDVRLEDIESYGLTIQDGAGSAERLVVRRTVPARKTGSGVAAIDTQLRISDVDIQDAHVAGLSLLGGEATVERVTVQRVGRVPMVAQADGLLITRDARVELVAAALLDNLRGGLAVAQGIGAASPIAAVRDLSVRGPTRTDASPHGFGVSVTQGPRLTLEGARILDAVGAGIGSAEGARLVLRGVEVRDTRRSGVPLALAYGLVADAGVRIDATDLRLVGSDDVGAWIGSRSVLRASRLEIGRSRRATLPGSGLRVSGGHAVVTDVALLDNEGPGMAVAPGSAVLSCGRIAGNDVGVQRAQANRVRLEDVVHADNERGPDACEASCVDRAPPPLPLD